MADKNPTVILPHSSVVDKIPSVDNALAGELYINSASGVGTSFLSTKKADNTMATFHEDEYWKGYIQEKSAEVVVISLPEIKEGESEVETGLQGETTTIFGVSEDGFYETIGAVSGTTCDEYYALIQRSLVLINGNPKDYDGNPMIGVPFIERYDSNEIMMTIHVHNWTGGQNGVITNSMADLLISINFDDLTVNFALTLWDYDEAHMAAPYKIGITTAFNNRDSEDEDLIISMQLRNYNAEPVTSKFVIDLLKAGKRVIFGSWDSDDKWEGVNGEYDLWAYSDNQLVVRWAHMARGKSVNSTHFFAHSYSVLVFDTNGCLEYNDTTDTPIKGGVYYYKPIMATEGDSYITSEIKDSTADNATPTLYVKAKTVALSAASTTEGNVVDGLVTANDVKAYVKKEIESSKSTYSLTINDEGIVSCSKDGEEDAGLILSEDGIVSLA